jgi:antitoxin ParD1/3/4
MPTRNVCLTAQQDAFVRRVVKSGEYQNASEAIRAALGALALRRREDELRLKVLRAELRRGLTQLDEGAAHAPVRRYRKR